MVSASLPPGEIATASFGSLAMTIRGQRQFKGRLIAARLQSYGSLARNDNYCKDTKRAMAVLSRQGHSDGGTEPKGWLSDNHPGAGNDKVDAKAAQE